MSVSTAVLAEVEHVDRLILGGYVDGLFLLAAVRDDRDALRAEPGESFDFAVEQLPALLSREFI